MDILNWIVENGVTGLALIVLAVMAVEYRRLRIVTDAQALRFENTIMKMAENGHLTAQQVKEIDPKIIVIPSTFSGVYPDRKTPTPD